MDKTYKAPNTPVNSSKRTKIVATVGPSSMSLESISQMIKSGANGLRLNFSHGDHEEKSQSIKWIRKASAEYGKPVAIIQDLQGPKIRLGDFEGVVNVQRGQVLRFGYGQTVPQEVIPTQYDLAKKVKRGERLYLYDGKISTVVESVREGLVYARANDDGILIKRKGINLPDTDFGGDILTKKDREDIIFGCQQDVDYVALSFVQHPEDIKKLRRILNNLGSHARIIAKIETRAAVDHLEGIVKEADAVMIARGDLAIETTPESVPILQRRIISYGLQYGRPTIVATQMLASMTDSPEPTRAEVSDVATAVLTGADAVMLSDETASGRYPTESVAVMKRVVLHTEANSSGDNPLPPSLAEGRSPAIAKAIISLADTLAAKAIVAETKSGATALSIAALRPRRPIISVTSDARVARQLAIVYGVKSYVRPDDKYAARKLTNWLQQSKFFKKGDIVVTASGQYPGMIGKTDTIKIRVLE